MGVLLNMAEASLPQKCPTTTTDSDLNLLGTNNEDADIDDDHMEKIALGNVLVGLAKDVYWDPMSSEDWEKEPPLPSCILRIKR